MVVVVVATLEEVVTEGAIVGMLVVLEDVATGVDCVVAAEVEVADAVLGAETVAAAVAVAAARLK